MTGRMYNEKWGNVHFVLTQIGLYLLFTMMLLLGLQGMPRRVYTFGAEYALPNLFASIGGFMIGAGVLVLIANLIVSWLRGPRVSGDPWP